MIFGYLYWDPNPEMFSIQLPLIHRGILWYGFLFAFGFFLGSGLFLHMLRRYFLTFAEYRKENFASLKTLSSKITERVLIYVVIGTLIGARLGDVLFYQSWDKILRDPLSIFKVWEGGLASHGAVVGIFISLWILSRRLPKTAHLSFLRLLDLVAAPTALAGVFIRLGNFFNQEILGVPTSLPWAIIFGHPLDGGPVVPRHPVQLYEAVCYGLICLLLVRYFHKHPRLERPGRLIGLFFVLVFSSRFFIEFVKMEQSEWLGASSILTMGQWLSIPVILFGLFLTLRRLR